MITPSEIKYFREQGGMNQSELAKRIGIGQQQLCRLELGQRRISESLSWRFERAFDDVRWENEVIAKAAMAQAIKQYFQV